MKSTIVRIIRLATRIASIVSPAAAAAVLERLFLRPMRPTRPAREEAWLSTARRSGVRFDDARKLPVYEWGTGPAVLLVHGWAGRGSQLGAWVAPLVASGRRVVAFDAPAHGDADGDRTAIPEFVRAIELVAEAAGPVSAIVAHSMGTAAATVALSRGLRVERVVYLAPPATPRLYLRRLARFLGFSDAVVVRTEGRIQRRFDARFDELDTLALAPRLHVPMWVAHDVGDTEVPTAEGRALVAAWPGAGLRVTEGLGHRRIVRDPSVIEDGVGFLVRRELQYAG